VSPSESGGDVRRGKAATLPSEPFAAPGQLTIMGARLGGSGRTRDFAIRISGGYSSRRLTDYRRLSAHRRPETIHLSGPGGFGLRVTTPGFACKGQARNPALSSSMTLFVRSRGPRAAAR
jgi:hypothetical protein